MTLHAKRFRTPVGEMAAAVDDAGRLVRLSFATLRGDAEIERDAARLGTSVTWDSDRAADAVEQLADFFAGRRTGFDLPLAPRGTAFQQRVWTELARIPFGETVSYRALAERIGSPAAVRAVGRANATNPLPVVVPCHRVIGADGSLTGYAGGVPAKEWLLALERRVPAAAAV